MSRTALLDIFVMFWVLAAFGCLVVDRDVYRARLACAAEAGEDRPPRTGIRWWRLGAGLCLGLACASKWNGVWFIPAFAAMSLAWDLGARRTAAMRDSAGVALVKDVRGMAASFVLLPVAAYLASWSGWLAAGTGYDRNWAQQHGVNLPVLSPLISLFEYNRAMLAFNTGLRTSHPYASKPWTWIMLARPVSYYWVCTAPSGKPCPSGTIPAGASAQEVLALGTPVLWWTSILALLVCLGWWLTRRDWRPGAVLVAVAAGWLPWFLFADRTQFSFYSVAFVPYLVLALTLCLGLILGPARATAKRRVVGAAIAGAYVLGVLVDFAYMYPVFAAKAIPYAQWLSRMWYHPGGHGWI
jgi:dolichyl-phosphate-mannose--protein O-mannosyl transferase